MTQSAVTAKVKKGKISPLKQNTPESWGAFMEGCQMATVFCVPFSRPGANVSLKALAVTPPAVTPTLTHLTPSALFLFLSP